jgi:hypothetical protein
LQENFFMPVGQTDAHLKIKALFFYHCFYLFLATCF